ncbi:unnamed protein product [Paramecium pentaurelia]|uniref:Uncharacterized protein n=1 Tax=Paramecium pentaurelia TaxID=43138 RepID=A0A8S1Y9A6_9CILI|nr:unnamed protein product [Paramecium pentaurelia]
MDNQKIIRWICPDPNCNLGRVVDTVPELLLHSKQQHKLIKFDKFREMIISVFDDSNLSRLQNEQHYLGIINNIQNLITFLKESLQNFEKTFKQKLDDFYEQIHPRKMFIEVTQAIMKQEDIDKEILTIYLDNYIKKFDISQKTQEKLDKLQSQIDNFCQSQQSDLISLFERQLQIRETANVVKVQQEIIPLEYIQQQIYQFDINKSSKEIIFTDNLKTAKAKDTKCFVYFKGVQEQKKVFMQVELTVLNDDDYIFNIGVVNANHNLNDYEGCYLLTQTGTFLLERETLQSKLKVKNGSKIKVRYAKKHPKKLFFQVDNNLNDKIQLNNELLVFYFIIIIKNAEVQLQLK